MGDFLKSIFTGSNPTLGGDINNAGNIMNFGTGTGEGDVRKASDFYGDILGGDPAKISKLLAPQIKTMQQQGQQKLDTLNQFGNRSGGTNATGQTVGDTTRSSIDDMISKLTGNAADKEGEMGEHLLDTGLYANQVQDQESQQQLQNMINSILGQGISNGIGSAEGFALGKAFPAKV